LGADERPEDVISYLACCDVIQVLCCRIGLLRRRTRRSVVSV
jgi:hypothetical protein